MEFFGFVINTWAAIIMGLFFIAMVIGCTFDRHHRESPKWWILAIAVLTVVAWQWSNWTFSWGMLFSATIWVPIGYYLAIGLGYSVIEFLLEVRRSARYWSNAWSAYILRERAESPIGQINTGFLERYGLYSKRIIGISKTASGIEPKINRSMLASSIGCWTFFWPFYLVSLIVGDLFTEIFNIAADFLASISGRFVRMAFKNVFKP